MSQNMTMEEFFRMRGKQEQEERLAKLRILNEDVRKGETVFTGSSLMEFFPINELLMTEGMHQVIYNRAVAGFTTGDMLEHMEEMVFGPEPGRIFINIGTNDIGQGVGAETLFGNYEKIIRLIKERLPGAEIYMMAYYPVNETDKPMDESVRKMLFATRTNQNIEEANRGVEALAEKLGVHFINVNEGLSDENGKLKAEYTGEGVHMYANAYRVILKNLKKYLGD